MNYQDEINRQGFGQGPQMPGYPAQGGGMTLGGFPANPPPTLATPATQDGMMYANGGAVGQPAVNAGGMPTGAPNGNTGVVGPQGMNWGGLLGGQQDWRTMFQDARTQFRDARQDWRQGGREGDRPQFRNFLFPNANGMNFQHNAGGGFIGQFGNGANGPTMQAANAPQMMPPLGMSPQPMPPQQIGTGLGVAGQTAPVSPFGLPGYGG